jgi:hypothetical protein
MGAVGYCVLKNMFRIDHSVDCSSEWEAMNGNIFKSMAIRHNAHHFRIPGSNDSDPAPEIASV